MSTPPAAPAPAAAGHNQGPVSDQDVNDWKNRFNEVLAAPSAHINAPAIEGAQDWNASFCGCCNPIDTCLITYCLPCLTFGKTYHRTRKNGSLEGYEPINTSCLLFFASMWVGLWWIPQSMQRADIRKKYNLKGSCITDIPIACCCALCDLVQQDKEADFRETQGGHNGAQQYKSEAGMTYAPQA